jgi:hypothetical protein
MRRSRAIQDRLSGPSRDSSPQKLTVTEISGEETPSPAILSDLTEGGLAMDCPQYFGPNAVVRIEGKLQAGGYSMHLVSRARVVSCRGITDGVYRVGIEFLDAEYRPVVG